MSNPPTGVQLGQDEQDVDEKEKEVEGKEVLKRERGRNEWKGCVCIFRTGESDRKLDGLAAEGQLNHLNQEEKGEFADRVGRKRQMLSRFDRKGV